jgi:hypothetical protein
MSNLYINIDKRPSHWLAAAGISTGAVFRSMHRGDTVGGARLTAQSVALIVKALAGRVGLDPSRFAGHSLRSGFLTSAARNRASIFKMADQSRHKSLDVLREYVRAQGNLRALMNMAGELLALAAHREAAQIDEKLFFELFCHADAAQSCRSASMRGLPVEQAYRLADRPEEQRWLVTGLWSEQAVGIVGGEPKCCKSFLALDLAVAVASGTACLRRFPVARPGRVLLYAAEDAMHVVRRRLEGICAAAACELKDLDVHVITAATVRIDQAADRERLEHTIAQLKPRRACPGNRPIDRGAGDATDIHRRAHHRRDHRREPSTAHRGTARAVPRSQRHLVRAHHRRDHRREPSTAHRGTARAVPRSQRHLVRAPHRLDRHRSDRPQSRGLPARYHPLSAVLSDPPHDSSPTTPFPVPLPVLSYSVREVERELNLEKRENRTIKYREHTQRNQIGRGLESPRRHDSMLEIRDQYSTPVHTIPIYA